MQSFLLLLDPPGNPDHQAIHCPTTNFGPLLRAHFSMSLPQKYVDLKESYDWDIKEQVITKFFLKKKAGFT